jgi:uncharacterized membrane protein YqaE (UPF0057 family)
MREPWPVPVRCIGAERGWQLGRPLWRPQPSMRTQPMDLLRIVFAILLPPLGVFLQVGLGLQFWLNILLTLLGYIPGIVHAIWIIARR